MGGEISSLHFILSSYLSPCLFVPVDRLHVQDELMEELASHPFHHKMSALANLQCFSRVLKENTF